MIAMKLPFAALTLAWVSSSSLPVAGAVPLSEPAAAYSVPEKPWTLELGHHQCAVGGRGSGGAGS